MKIHRIAILGTVLLMIFGLLIGSVSAQTGTKSGKKAKKVKKVKKAPVEIELSQSLTELTERLREKAVSRQTGGTKSKTAARGKSRTDFGKPTESKLDKAGTFNGDLRDLPKTNRPSTYRPERDGPTILPFFVKPPTDILPGDGSTEPQVVPAAPAPVPLVQFDGIGRPPGNGFPPDTVVMSAKPLYSDDQHIAGRLQ